MSGGVGGGEPRSFPLSRFSVNESLMRHRNRLDDIKTGERGRPGKSMADIYLLARRCPCKGDATLIQAFVQNLRNLAGDGKGKGASATT
jgi:hypothetical protein